MRTCRLRSLAVVLAVTLLGACGTNTGVRVFGEGSADVRVKAGDDFALQLESNITTGYTWQFADKPDEAVVRLVDERYEAPADKGPVGAGGQQRFTLHAVAKGTTIIKLHYVRPWEQPPVPNREATFTIVVS
jgi:predicted secreted protein